MCVCVCVCIIDKHFEKFDITKKNLYHIVNPTTPDS